MKGRALKGYKGRRSIRNEKTNGHDDATLIGITLIMLSLLCFSLTGIYGYSTFFAVLESENYEGTIVSGPSTGSEQTENYQLDVSIGEPVVGDEETESYRLEIGSIGYLGSDSSPPFLEEQYQSSSTPIEGDKVILSVKYTDSSPPITVVFWDSINGEGRPKTITSGQTAEFIFDTTGIEARRAIKWKVTASDIFGNSNITSEVEFTIGVIDEEPPAIIEVKQASDEPIEGNPLAVSVKASDNYGLKEIVFEVNGIEQTPQRISGKDRTVVYRIGTSGYAPGTEVQWRAFVKDGSELEAITDMKTFTVKAASQEPNTCSDGTSYGECSANKPKFCDGGRLVERCSDCDCLMGWECQPDGNCEKHVSADLCSDGTEYGECSFDMPKYCEDGELLELCGLCGCPGGKECIDNVCEASKTIYWIGGGVVAAIAAGIGGVLLLKKKKEEEEKNKLEEQSNQYPF